MDEPKLQLTEREIAEIKHAMMYNAFLNHGTVGHNQLVIIAKLAIHLGFVCAWEDIGIGIDLPADVEIAQ